MIKDALTKLADGADLSVQEAETVMLEIMDGAATSAQMAAYLMGLRQKGETVAEVVGSVSAMRSRATRIRVGSSIVVDTCGTGGDGADTFNISTTAAFVAAGAGITVAKHGNRSVSSRSGSADVLSMLGVKIDLEPSRVADCIDEVGIGFLFAPLYHGAMKQCSGVRHEMGIRTILNVLGPLANPAGATHQVLGVYDAKWTDILGRVLLELGSQHCFVVHGLDGLDEITLSDRTKVSEGKGGVVSSYFIAPEEFEVRRTTRKEFVGSSPEENARMTKEILHGGKGSRRDIVCLNAAPAMVVGQKSKTLKDGFRLAQQTIDSGAAAEKLDRLIAFTKKACKQA
jgi:anthranilate phosphoribosyltransferase